jgi:hypothetical protein
MFLNTRRIQEHLGASLAESSILAHIITMTVRLQRSTTTSTTLDGATVNTDHTAFDAPAPLSV